MLNSWAVPSGNTLAPLFEAYTEITALGKFVEMNGEGFRKIVKKYDKVMGTDFLGRRGGRAGGRGGAHSFFFKFSRRRGERESHNR